jgi:ferric-dicitrate binding protein FerR (iron transport regulator)
MAAFGERVAHAQDALQRETSVIAAARARWLESDEPALSVPVARVRPWSFALAAVVLFALGFATLGRVAQAPLTFEVGPAESAWPSQAPAPGVVGQWVTSANQPMPIRFSDGSVIRLGPAGRGCVVEAAKHGARVVLEHGSAHATIVHHRTTRWNVEAGPFEVKVVGTVFEVAWEPQTELFTVKLEQGAVSVSGCALPRDRVVATGETFRAVCHDGHVEFPESTALAKPDASAEQSTAVTGSATAAPPNAVVEKSVETAAALGVPAMSGAGHPPARSAGSAGGASSTGLTASPWRDLIADGQYAQALEAANARGLADVCMTAPAPDLLRLADAARFSAHPDDAGFILGRLRERFPEDDLASVAAFDMGRIAFDTWHSYGDAARWFDLYLKERPSGVLAREASGRIMEALERSGSHAQARDRADRYLQIFVNGPHAALARSILEK